MAPSGYLMWQSVENKKGMSGKSLRSMPFQTVLGRSYHALCEKFQDEFIEYLWLIHRWDMG